MSLATLGQIALPIADADRSEAFYSSLGLPKLFRFGDLVFFDCGGIRLMLDGSSKKPVQAGTGVCHYFKAPQIEAVTAELKTKGVAFEAEPHLVARMPDHELWMAFFRDPDGHLLALMEEKR
jgi:methylmalonyl-CoA/ethylmalonyl-CoA epimerase